MSGYSFLYGVDDRLNVQRIGKIMVYNFAAAPVNQGVRYICPFFIGM